MKRRAGLLLSCLFLLHKLPATGSADLILQPVSASTTMGTDAGSPNNTRNQSGLNVAYISLVTDFDTYLASNPTHTGNTTGWRSGFGNVTGNFDYALGGLYTIQSFVLWNMGAGTPSESINDFTLLADDNAAFSSPVILGNFSSDMMVWVFDPVMPEIFSFTPTSASFVRLMITSNQGATLFSSFGEGAFEIQSATVPEPSSAVLACFILPVLAFRRYRVMAKTIRLRASAQAGA